MNEDSRYNELRRLAHETLEWIIQAKLLGTLECNQIYVCSREYPRLITHFENEAYRITHKRIKAYYTHIEDTPYKIRFLGVNIFFSFYEIAVSQYAAWAIKGSAARRADRWDRIVTDHPSYGRVGEEWDVFNRGS